MFKVQTPQTNMRQKIQTVVTKGRHVSTLAVMLVAITLSLGIAVVPRFASADSVDDRIDALLAENARNDTAVADLMNQAVSFRDAVTRLQSQINILQGQIDTNAAKQADLNAKIEAGQAELARQRSLLGNNLRTMYLEGQISTLEMLATSKNLSDFVDKEEYRTAVKSKIQETLKKIARLQAELRGQEQMVTALLNEQRASQATLNASRAEQARMLAYNQSQQASFNKKTSDNQKIIDRLMEEQRRANEDAGPGGYYFLRFSGEVGSFNPSNYPYANAGFSMSTAPGCNDNDGPDKWGYCTRQCVSYAAWAVEASGRTAPRYYGDAKKWIDAARRNGVSIYSTPKAGDVAITVNGRWGHAMYVESVSGNTIKVSQYNQAMTGRLSYQDRTWR